MNEGISTLEGFVASSTKLVKQEAKISHKDTVQQSIAMRTPTEVELPFIPNEKCADVEGKCAHKHARGPSTTPPLIDLLSNDHDKPMSSSTAVMSSNASSQMYACLLPAPDKHHDNHRQSLKSKNRRRERGRVDLVKKTESENNVAPKTVSNLAGKTIQTILYLQEDPPEILSDEEQHLLDNDTTSPHSFSPKTLHSTAKSRQV